MQLLFKLILPQTTSNVSFNFFIINHVVFAGVETVESVEVEAPKEISFDQLLEFHKAEQEKTKLESI